jgi:hypothetical protein
MVVLGRLAMVGRVAVAAAGAGAWGRPRRRATAGRWVRRVAVPTTARRGRGTIARPRQRAGGEQENGGGEELENGN